MKIYNHSYAPNPRRVRIFLAEKGVHVPYQEVDIIKGESRSPEFRKKNPYGGLPVLELDDGTCIAESIAICRYFEELHPKPPLFGEGAVGRAIVEMWNRRLELNLFQTIGNAARHGHPFFKDRVRQVPAFAEQQREAVDRQLELLDGMLADRPFMAGEHYTVADITALCPIDFARTFLGLEIKPEHKNLARWHKAVSARPSAAA